jgi:hypothetical protein
MRVCFVAMCCHSVKFVYARTQSCELLKVRAFIQGDQKISVHLMITVQKTRKNILNSFSHLP